MATKYLQAGFGLSLILNAFLIGFLAGGPGPFGGPPPFPDPEKRFYDAARHLPAESREKVLTTLDDRVQQMRAHHADSFKGFDSIRSILTAPELDIEALNQAFEGMTKRHNERAKLMDDILRSLALSFENDEHRVQFFEEALPSKPPFSPPGKNGKAGPHGGDGPPQEKRK